MVAGDKYARGRGIGDVSNRFYAEVRGVETSLEMIAPAKGGFKW
jgi:hypothetical protein